MTRIAVVTSQPAFMEGGHLVLARALVKALRAAGHDSALVSTPQNRFGCQGAAYLATWLTDVGMTGDARPIDQVISLRYPSYAVRHPVHVCWLNHTMREYYDQWDAFSAPLSWKGRLKENVRRRLVHAADRHLLKRHVQQLFVISGTVQRRLERWNHLPSTVLYPPPAQRPYRCDEYGDYIFALSRLTPLKRLDLLVEALAQPAAEGVRCVIAGDGPEREALRARIARHCLESRVRLIGHVSDEILVEHLGRCRAVCFPPFDEEYGFIAVEAFASSKPVITCVDSGGPAELVRDGVNGLVCDATPQTLALALRRVMDDSRLAEQLGSAGQRNVADLTWERTIQQLVVV